MTRAIDSIMKPNDPPTPGQSLSELTDRSLLKRFRSGSEDAAAALYLRYAQRLQRLADAQVGPELAVRMDPEGLVQSVFRTFFRRAASGQYDVGDQEDLWKLLLVMALNKIRSAGSYHRASKRDIAVTQTLPDQVADGVRRPDDEMALNILKLTIEELLSGLPVEQQQMILLRIEGHEVNEIAAHTGRAKRSVERILQSFRQQLQKQIGVTE